MIPTNLNDQLTDLLKQKGSIQLTHDEGGSGMSYFFCATAGGEWPYCHAATVRGALQNLVTEHLRLEREALQQRINEIDNSASL